MRPEAKTARLRREFRRLFRCMDFLAEHPALRSGRRSQAAEQLAEAYQLLGLAWEFLALQCRHTEGFRRTREGKRACRICGTIAGTDETWILLPQRGRKVVGRHAQPNSAKIFPNQRTARLIDDTIRFHGAKLRVEVQNGYRSRLSGTRDISVAADRMVKLVEAGVECDVDRHMVSLRFQPRKRGVEPPCGSFVFELPRKALRRFPVLLEYDRRGRFVGLCVFPPVKKLTQLHRSGHGSVPTPM
jgi:hypothetical protein